MFKLEGGNVGLPDTAQMDKIKTSATEMIDLCQGICRKRDLKFGDGLGAMAVMLGACIAAGVIDLPVANERREACRQSAVDMVTKIIDLVSQETAG